MAIGTLAAGVVTAVLTYSYLTWSGTNIAAFLIRHWAWGLLGVLAAARLPCGWSWSTPTGAGSRPQPTSWRRLAGTLV